MNRTLAPLATTLGAAAVLVMAQAASAQVLIGPERIYPPPPRNSPAWRETPMYAPDAPPPRSYNNPGIPDHQNGTRNGG
jgi:hypothetical protein